MRRLKKDRKGGAFALVLVILLIVFVVLVIPSVVSGEGFSFDGIIDDITGFFNNLFGGGSSTTGYCGVGFTIHYQDGTTDEYGASPTFQITPMTIKVANKPVDMIEIFVRAKFTTENIGPWTSEVEQQIEMYKKPSDADSTPEYSSSGYFSESGSSWASGTVKNLAVTSLDWEVIEAVVAGHGPAAWHFQVNVSVDLEAEIDGVTQSFDALAPSGGFELVYSTSDGEPTMSITTGTTPIA